MMRSAAESSAQTVDDPTDPSANTSPAEPLEVCSDAISLPNPAGLHARPATILANAAKQFRAEIRLGHNGRVANAKSPVSLLKLGVRHRDAIQIAALGDDADAAVARLVALVTEGCGDDLEAAAMPTVAATATRPTDATSGVIEAGNTTLSGIAAAPGLAVGQIVQFRRAVLTIDAPALTPDQEQENLSRALEAAMTQLDSLGATTTKPAETQILAAHRGLIEDSELIDRVRTAIRRGLSAAAAWRNVCQDDADAISRLDDPRLRQRADDIRDVGERVLAILVGTTRAAPLIPDNAILIAEELTPSDTISFDREKVLGFCCTGGGATSHVAILARALGLPAICGIDPAALRLADGVTAILDGSRGLLAPNPTDDVLAQARIAVEKQIARRTAEEATARQPARLKDGSRIEVVANIASAQDAIDAVAAGAEGIGLLRSEFLFDKRTTPPSESEQTAEYSAVATTLGANRPLVIRTLDVGGDKPLSYLPMAKEDNPFLGLRGIRLSLDQPAQFRIQLRAILRAAPLTQMHIMFPMVATLEELRQARAILAEEQRTVPAAVKIGVMIEVPSAALLAEQIAAEVDFFSIGTNDLTQYTLAMDRGHARLARQADALHPAVLRMIAMTVDGAHKHGKWVGVCGAMASDPIAIPALVGLGIDELSVSIPAIATVKAILAGLTREHCQSLAKKLLKMGTAAEVRDALVAIVD